MPIHLPSALIILPAPYGPAELGDRVVLRRLVAFLQQRYACTLVDFGRVDNIRRAMNLLACRTPVELAAHWDRRHRIALRSRMSTQTFDLAFILHEGLFYLAREIDTDRVPVTLFAHNILSRFTTDSVLQPVFARLARRYENLWYRQKGARLVLISHGDRDAAVRAGLAKPDAPIAPPGAPPAHALDAEAIFSGEIVLTGTYGWWRKRQDLEDFGKRAAGLSLVAFDETVGEVLPRAAILPSHSALDWTAAIRVGVITDRFAGGFKLKSLEYVANNCVVFSRARIFEEFEMLPHASSFVVDNLDVGLWADRIAAMQAQNKEALRSRFLEFKAACLARYDWATCLEPLAPGNTLP